jgi:hypothetical protein
MTDAIEWANFVLGLIGAVGTAGIAVLLYQWYIDNFSKHPFRTDPLTPGWTNKGGQVDDLTFLIANRTTGTANVTVAVLVERPPPARPDVLGSTRAIVGPAVSMDVIMGEGPNTDTFVLPAKSTRRVSVKATLASLGYAGPLRVNLMDERYRLHFFRVPFNDKGLNLWVANLDRVGDQRP